MFPGSCSHLGGDGASDRLCWRSWWGPSVVQRRQHHTFFPPSRQDGGSCRETSDENERAVRPSHMFRLLGVWSRQQRCINHEAVGEELSSGGMAVNLVLTSLGWLWWLDSSLSVPLVLFPFVRCLFLLPHSWHPWPWCISVLASFDLTLRISLSSSFRLSEVCTHVTTFFGFPPCCQTSWRGNLVLILHSSPCFDAMWFASLLLPSHSSGLPYCFICFVSSSFRFPS